MKRCRLTSWGLSFALAIAGCDNRSNAPNGVPSTQPATATTEKPARIPLQVIPFSMEVPRGWEIKALENAALVLEGRTASAIIDIQLGKSAMSPMSRQAVDAMVENAGLERDRHPEAVRLVAVKTVGAMLVLERQSFPLALASSAPATSPSAIGVNPTTSATTTPTTTTTASAADPARPYSWTLLLMTPAATPSVAIAGPQMDVYQLNLIGLTYGEFLKEQALLRAMFNSLEYVPPTGY